MLMSIVVVVAVAIVGAIILAYLLGSRVVSNKDLKEPFSIAQRIQPDLCDGSECSRRPRQMLKYRPFGPLASDGMCFYYRPANEVECDPDVNGKRFVSSEYDAPTTLDSVATPICVYDGRFRCDKAADACTWACENVDQHCIGTVRSSSSSMCGREMDGSKCVDPACETKAAQTGFCHAIADGNEPMFVKVGEHHALREYSHDPPFQMAADSHRIDLSEYIMGPADLAFSPVEPAATTRLRIDNYIATITNGRSNKMVDYVVAMDRCTLRPMGITRFVISVFELPLNEKPTPKSTCVAVDESTLSLGTLSGSTTFPLSKFFSYDATTRFSPWSISSDSVTIDEGPPRRVGIAVGNTGAPMQATITNASCRGNVTLTWTEPRPQPSPSPSPPADDGHCRDLSGVWLEKTYGARFIVRMDNRTLSTGGEVVGRVYLLRSTGVTNPYVEDRGTLNTVFGAVPAWPNKRDTFWFEALPDEPNNRNNSSSTGTHAVFSIDRASRKSILKFVKDDSSADARAFRQWEFEGVGKMPGCVGAFESVCSRGAFKFVATRSDTPCPSPTPCVNVCNDCSGTYMDAKNAQQPKVTLTVKMDMSTGSGTVVYHWDTRVHPPGDQTFPTTPLKCLGNNIFSWGGWTDGTFDSTIKKFTWNNAAGDTWEKSFIDCSGTYRDTKNVTQQHVSLTVTMNTSTGIGSVVYHWIDSLSFKIVDHAYADIKGIGDNNRFSWGGWSEGTYDSTLRKFTWKSNNNDVWEREPDRSGTYSGATSAASKQVYVYMNPKSGKGYIKDTQWGSQKRPGLIYFDRNTAALTCEHWFSRSKTTGTYSVNTIEWAVSGGAKETWTFVGKPPNPTAKITTVDISGVWTEGANKVLVYFDEKSGHGSVQWLSEKKSLYDVGYIDAIYANLAATVCTTYYIDYWFEQGFHGTLDDTRQTLTWKYNTEGNLPDRIWKRSSL